MQFSGNNTLKEFLEGPNGPFIDSIRLHMKQLPNSPLFTCDNYIDVFRDILDEVDGVNFWKPYFENDDILMDAIIDWQYRICEFNYNFGVFILGKLGCKITNHRVTYILNSLSGDEQDYKRLVTYLKSKGDNYVTEGFDILNVVIGKEILSHFWCYLHTPTIECLWEHLKQLDVSRMTPKVNYYLKDLISYGMTHNQIRDLFGTFWEGGKAYNVFEGLSTAEFNDFFNNNLHNLTLNNHEEFIIRGRLRIHLMDRMSSC